MATSTRNPGISEHTRQASSTPGWPREGRAPSTAPSADLTQKPSPSDALQALLAFSALHEQVRHRKALASKHSVIDAGAPAPEFDEQEQFVLDEVLKLVAERAVAITGADGMAIALAENNEIVLRAAAGTVCPDIGARIDRDSAFSGACFRQAQVVICDDTETDPRVNLQACRKLGARSMVAVPLCGRRRVIGLLEAFSSWPFGFNDSDVRNLSLLAELVVGALKPEDEDRFAQSAQAAATKLESETKSVPAPPAAPAVNAPAIAASTTVTAKPANAVPPVVSTVAASSTLSSPRVVPQNPAATLSSSAAPKTPVATPAIPAPKTPSLAAPSAPSGTTSGTAPAPAIAAAAVAEKEAAAEISTATVEAPAEPALTFGQINEEKKQRPTILWLLMGVVVATAFAGGMWWKLKTAQLGSAMVQTEKVAPQTVNPVTAPPAASTATPAVPTPSVDAAAATDKPTDNEAPASPQELAKFPRVSGIRHWSSADSSTVVLDLEDQVQYEAHRLSNPDRIYFDLHDTQLAPELVGKAIEVGDALLSRVRLAQPIAGMTRVVLETKANTTFSVSLEPNPYRLVVDVHKIGTTPKGAVNLFPNSTEAEKNKLAIVIPPPTKEDFRLRALVPKLRIVVDAGHGGWDLGTVGRRGLLEKDLVLEISQRLGKLLENRLGADVIYTRPDDNYITLDERASIANQSQADLFVSVHANYSDLPSARGVETYYTNFFSAPGSKDADTHATTGAAKPGIPALSAADLHDRIEQSRRLAASVQRSLYGTLSAENPGLRDRGIKEASFVVLTESAMPGILAEVSFVSSPTDEQKLRSDGYREQIAEALYRGIARYAATSKNVKVAAK